MSALWQTRLGTIVAIAGAWHAGTSLLLLNIIVRLPFFFSRPLAPLIDTLDRLALLYPLRALAG
jgi:hypothetical protein